MIKCRGCLICPNTPIPLKQGHKKKFFQITGLELSETTDEYLCKKCIKLLNISWQFRKEALEANSWFENLTNDVETEVIIDVKCEVTVDESTDIVVDTIPALDNDDELYICDICNDDFNTYRKILEHMRKHKKELGRFCRFCDKVFPNRTKMTNHERKHLNKISTPTVCEHCGKAYSNIRQLRIHARSHTETYKCTMDGCTDAFTQKRAYYGHFKTKHGINQPCVCADCGNTFSNHLTLKNHRRLFHGEGIKIGCPECPKFCLNKGQLEIHMAVKHRGERKHMCHVCSKTYGLSNHLKRHYKDSHYDIYLELVKTKKKWKL